MANVKEIRKMVEALVDEFKDAVEQMDNINEWDSLGELKDNFSTIVELIESLAEVVSVIKDVMGDDAEVSEIIDEVAEYLDEKIKLPFYLEPIDEFAIKFILNLSYTALSKYAAGNRMITDQLLEKAKELKDSLAGTDNDTDEDDVDNTESDIPIFGDDDPDTNQ